uniref:(northern house mosquito) hypothetical protein n=1 Tax=Culex pipiens TaxID=7175 RepID=A0A8D8NPS0_CULPI
MCCLTRPASTASATTGSRRTGTSATGSSWSWTRSARPPWTPSARRRTCVRHGTVSSRTRCGRQRRDSESGSDCPGRRGETKKRSRSGTRRAVRHGGRTETRQGGSEGEKEARKGGAM